MSLPDYRELLKPATKTREQLFEEAFDAHAEKILWYFRERVGDYHLGEDLAQQFWVYVYQRFPEGKMNQTGLLIFKARQMLIDHWRKSANRDILDFVEHLPEGSEKTLFAEPGTPEQEKAFEQKFWSEFPDVGITPHQKHALWLKVRHGYTLNEVAEKLGTSKSTVDDWIRIARGRILAYLNSEK